VRAGGAVPEITTPSAEGETFHQVLDIAKDSPSIVKPRSGGAIEEGYESSSRMAVLSLESRTGVTLKDGGRNSLESVNHRSDDMVL
jgi:hypothetical protein